MYTVWTPVACQDKSFMGYCERASDARADHSFASRTFASVTCNSLKSSPTPGRSLRQTGKPGVGVWRTGLTGLRWRPGPRRLSRGGRERNVKDQIKRPPITSVPAATKIATQESGFWATQEPTNTDALTIASPRRGCHYYYYYYFCQTVLFLHMLHMNTSVERPKPMICTWE